MTNEPEQEKKSRIQQIRNLYAFVLFSQHRFDESLKIFADLGTGEDQFTSSKEGKHHIPTSHPPSQMPHLNHSTTTTFLLPRTRRNQTSVSELHFQFSCSILQTHHT